MNNPTLHTGDILQWSDTDKFAVVADEDAFEVRVLYHRKGGWEVLHWRQRSHLALWRVVSRDT